MRISFLKRRSLLEIPHSGTLEEVMKVCRGKSHEVLHEQFDVGSDGPQGS